MRVALAIVAALSFLDVGLCEKITFTGSPAAHANIMVLSSALAKAYKAPSIAKRQVQIEDRGIQIGGAAKDKKKGAGKGQIGGAARNQTAEGLAALEGARQRANGTANAGNGLALGDILSGGSRGDKAAKPAAGKEKAQPAKGEAAAPAKGKGGERWRRHCRQRIGANVGGNLGITKGSDGSTSVGGAAGINILSLVDEKDADEAHDTEDAE
ncbi:hypothetical protein PG987_003191 [Apiospora arundinis]